MGREFQQTLELQTDGNGNVTSAAMAVPTFLTKFQTCYVQKLIGAKIQGAVDAKANVDLHFFPR